MTEYSVLLIDDHLLLREGIKAMLNRLEGFICIGEAGSGRLGIEMAIKLQPDIVVVDIDLGRGINGFDVASEIKSISPHINILMLTGNPQPKFFQKAIKVGCGGYMLKVDSDTELVQALETVAGGGKYLSRSFTGEVFAMLQVDELDETVSEITINFTPREKSIATLISQGMNDEIIGAELGISPKTVRVHKSNIKRKCKCKTTGELIVHLGELDF